MPNHVTNKIEFYGEQKDIDKVLELIKGEDRCIDFNKIILMPKELMLPSGGDTNYAVQYALSKKSYGERIRIKAILELTPCSFYRNYYRQIFAFHTYNNAELKERADWFENNLADNGKTSVFDETDYKRLGIKNFEDLGNAYINNIINHGADTWYDWSCKNWGTKWNAYDCQLIKEDNEITFDTAWSCPLPILDALAKLCYEHNVSFSGRWADEDAGQNVGIFESDCDSDEYWFSYNYIENGSNEAYEIYTELKGESNCIGQDEDGNWVHYDCDDCPNRDKC